MVPRVIDGPDSERPRWGRCVLAVAWLIALSSAPFVQFSIRITHLGLDASTWPYVYSYWGAAILGVALFIADLLPRPTVVGRRAAARLAPVALFAAWAIASVLWTDSPYVTPSQAILMAALLPGAIWFGGGLRFGEQAVTLAVAMHVLVLASIVAVRLAPHTSTDLGFWSGVFANRNTLGPVAGLAAMSLLGVHQVAQRRWVTAACIAMCLVDLLVLARSGSDTPWFGLALAVLVVGPVNLLLRRLTSWGVPGRRVAVGGGALAVAAWFLLFRLIGPLTRAVGKDETLSNRRVVWQYLREVSATRRWSGYGFSSFWDNESLVYGLYLRTQTIFDSAHSTLMEVFIGLGLIGVALLLVIAGLGIAVSSRRLWSERSASSTWWAAVFAFVAAENLTESMISYHSFHWSLVVAAGFVGWSGSSPTPDDARRQGLPDRPI